jgi:hypothetical protein
MNPFLDKGGAAFGGIVMAATLATVLGINAATTDEEEHFVFYVTLPAAFLMFCWDMAFGWIHRHETREIAARGRRELEEAKRVKATRDSRRFIGPEATDAVLSGALTDGLEPHAVVDKAIEMETLPPANTTQIPPPTFVISQEGDLPESGGGTLADEGAELASRSVDRSCSELTTSGGLSTDSTEQKLEEQTPQREATLTETGGGAHTTQRTERGPASIDSLLRHAHRWAQETFPTPIAVLMHLPFALVPFAFAMFVLVQALVTKGWVPVFAHGWDHWVQKTGTVGAIGGMGFLSVILCNVSVY